MVCRRVQASASLVQLKTLVPQTSAKAGRCGYICISAACLQQLSARHLAQGFKGACATTPQEVNLDVHALAEHKILLLLGLARRCGSLLHGVDKVAALAQEMAEYTADEPEAEPPSAALFAACDLAPRSLRKLGGVGVFLESESLGAATGLQGVGAVAIVPGRLGLQAAYWFRVWYETLRPSTAITNSHNAIEVAR
jgi:predicted RNA-binding protein YlxR (DUF448 family)